MQKELNPELFGNSNSIPAKLKESEAPSLHRAAQQTELKVAESKAQIKQISDQMMNLVQQVNEFIKITQSRVDKLYLHAKHQDVQTEAFKNENAQKMSMVHARLNERKSMDSKVQEMIDRHNSVLRSFEVRMNHMQRLMAEKDALLVDAQAALNDAKMEISRLKRL